jgi:release factor glutamine methyltransferase
VFIPRHDTETLVEAVWDAMRDDPPDRILEIGPGTGVIALSLLGEWPRAHALAVDRSPDAARCTRSNARELGQADRIQVVVGDLDAAISPSLEVDLLVSNPPYIAHHEALDASVRDHEPHLALFAGEGGFSVIDALVAMARTRLRPGGLLAFEIGAGQGDEACARVRDAAHLGPPELRRDLAGHDRAVLARRDGG